MKKPTPIRRPAPVVKSKAIAVPPKNPTRHEVKRAPDPFRGQKTFSLDAFEPMHFKVRYILVGGIMTDLKAVGVNGH